MSQCVEELFSRFWDNMTQSCQDHEWIYNWENAESFVQITKRKWWRNCFKKNKKWWRNCLLTQCIKPSTFNKKILFPLCYPNIVRYISSSRIFMQTIIRICRFWYSLLWILFIQLGTCNFREGVSLGSILECSIPMLHSCYALQRFA